MITQAKPVNNDFEPIELTFGRVKLYRNLNKNIWSIVAMDGENKGRVVAYRKKVIIKNCLCKVSEKSRQRVLRQKTRNVHAWIIGEHIATVPEQVLKELKVSPRLTYNPYLNKSFIDAQSGKSIANCQWAIFNEDFTVNYIESQ